MLALTSHPRNRRASVLDAARFVTSPVLIGTPTVGTPVTCTPGTTYGSPTITLAYQWQLGGVDISGATSASYTPSSADAGGMLRRKDTPSGPLGAGAPAYSAAIAVAGSGGGSGTATVTWVAPQHDGDNAALTDLANYKVYWGTTFPVTATNSAGNSGPLALSPLSYTATGLTAATRFYFAVSALDSSGNESFFQNDGSAYKDIP